jgi:hypothetical protein
MKINRQRGFSGVESLLIVGVIAVLVVGGFLLVKRNSPQESRNMESTNASSPAPEVKNAKDLDAAEKTLDQTDIDAAAQDSSELYTLTNDL